MVSQFKEFLTQLTMGPILNGISGDRQFKESVYCYNGITWAIVWDPNNIGDQYKVVVGLWRSSVREVLLYILYIV